MPSYIILILSAICVRDVKNVQGFQLNEYYNNDDRTIDIYPCPNVSDKLWSITKDATDAANGMDYFNFVLHSVPKTVEDGIKTILCNTDDRSGTYFYTTRMDIKINNDMLSTANTLYNTLLHELGHAMGLSHSIKFGIMNYTIKNVIPVISRFRDSTDVNAFVGLSRTEKRSEFFEDELKLWYSFDDINGFIQSYRETKKRYCDKVTIFIPWTYYGCVNSPWGV